MNTPLSRTGGAPKLSACIEWILQSEYPDFCDRIGAAAAAGMYGVEFHFWRSKPLDAIKRALAQSGLVLTSMVVEPRVCLIAPDQRRVDFLNALKESIVAAVKVGAPALVVASGPKDENLSQESQHQAMVEALKIAAPLVADAGITLLLEPVNTLVDHPGVFLDRTPQGLDVIEQVGHPAVRLLYDIYHSAAMGERPNEVLGSRVHLIHHVQAADLPGRHQPGTGAIAWREVLGALRTRGYTGTIGLEYRPLGSGADSLRQARATLSA